MARKRQEQAHLPTMEPPKSAKLDGAAQRYVEARDTWMVDGKVVTECKEELIAFMEEEGVTEYENGDIWIKIETGKKKVKVRISGNEPENDDEGEEE